MLHSDTCKKKETCDFCARSQQLEESRLRHNDTKFSSRRNRGSDFLELSRDQPRSDHDVWTKGRRGPKL